MGWIDYSKLPLLIPIGSVVGGPTRDARLRRLPAEKTSDLPPPGEPWRLSDE